jgi:hypothetical protein
MNPDLFLALGMIGVVVLAFALYTLFVLLTTVSVEEVDADDAELHYLREEARRDVIARRIERKVGG